MNMPIKLCILFLLSFGLSSCKTLSYLDQVVAQPKLSVVSFAMAEASLLKQVFQVEFKVDNPNLFALPLLGFDYGLDVAGVPIAKGLVDQKVSIPAGGSQNITIDLNTNLVESLPNLTTMLMKGQKDFQYELKGHLKTENTLINSIPFTKVGAFNFKMR